MKDPFKNWTKFVIEVLLFLLVLSACGRLLRLEWIGWTSEVVERPVTNGQV